MTELGIGMLGYRFMGRAHAHAYRTLGHMVDPDIRPRLVAVAGRDAGAVAAAAPQLGFAEASQDWRALVEDPRIDVFDNAGPNGLHAEPTVAAAQAGKHVICEKPLGRTAAEALETWRAVQAAGVVHMCAFNYRFVPAVRLARELIAGGELGEVRHFRARYLQDWLADPAAAPSWRLSRAEAGSGALGDLGSHIVDLARYLVDEPTAVTGRLATFVGRRGGTEVDVDDAFAATLELASGAVGTLEASRASTGRKNALTFEVDGTRGSLAFDLERLNELQLMTLDGPTSTRGFRTILVTEPEHPFLASWWPPGHVLGWEHTFVHELHHFLQAIATGGDVAPHGATFRDGYRAAEVCEAIERSSAIGERVQVEVRELDDAHALAPPAPPPSRVQKEH
jgi:predicted dehydrogenase